MNQEIEQKFSTYPDGVRDALLAVRNAIFELGLAHELPIEEALKWGQLSYLTKKGSTIRIDQVLNSPTEIGIYFNCKTRIVETIKETYGDMFDYKTNRVLIFDIKDFVVTAELKQCLLLGLKYHQLKQLPLLGL